jgi:hypothetical protein
MLAAGAAVAVAAVIAVVLLAGGDGNKPATQPAARTTTSPTAGPEPTPSSDSAPTNTGSSTSGTVIPGINRAAGIETMRAFADYFEDENLGGLEERMAPGFRQTIRGKTCSGAKSPMGIDATLEEYQCQFDQLDLPAMKISGFLVRGGRRRGQARANYVLTDKGRRVAAGTLTFVIVPAKDYGIIKALAITR